MQTSLLGIITSLKLDKKHNRGSFTKIRRSLKDSRGKTNCESKQEGSIQPTINRNSETYLDRKEIGGEYKPTTKK